jgi:hypothetical protein
VIKKNQPWISASPDGWFEDDEGKISLVEIKCPFQSKDQETINVNYVTTDGELKKSHLYYTQVQIQMYCCNSDNCVFFLYSKSAEPVIINVPFDKEFC